MRVTIQFASYNQRRYGKPWIAVVTAWPVGGKPEVRWGSFIGDARNGSAGECEIEAEPGDVVRWGQKDNRGGNTDACWGIVDADGNIVECKAEMARKHFSEQALATKNVQPVSTCARCAELTEALKGACEAIRILTDDLGIPKGPRYEKAMKLLEVINGTV